MDMGAEGQPLQVSLFNLLKNEYGEELPVVSLTKIALVEISHILEATVLHNKMPSMVFTGFQESKYWRREVQRYRELAGIAHSIYIFSGGALNFDAKNDTNLVKVTLANDDFLRQEWFLIVLTHEFSVLLCGLDRLEVTEREAERVFDTVLTFEPEVIAHTLDLLEGVLENYAPQRMQQIQEGRHLFPPVSPRPHYISLLTAQFTEQAGLYRATRRQLDQEQAMRATISRLLHDASQPVTTLLALLDLSKQLGEVLPEDLDMLIETGYALRQILDELREVTRYSTRKYGEVEYLDTGKPIFGTNSNN